MANREQVKDEELRAKLEEAHAQLRAGKATDAVHTLADTFLSMLRMKPELLAERVAVRGRDTPLVMRWPALGANFKRGSVQAGAPEIEFTRERFAISEALTYYEFTVDTAIAQGM